MYSIEGLNSLFNIKPPIQLFLSGDENTIKLLCVDIVKKQIGLTPVFIFKDGKYINNLFYSKTFPVLMEETSLFDSVNLIKFSKNKLTKKIKNKFGFTEIVCNRLFPNQVKQFVNLCCSLYDVKLPEDLKDDFAYYFKDDLYKITNYIKIIKYGNVCDNYYLLEDLDINLTKCVDFALTGNSDFFIKSLPLFKDYFGFVWILILKLIEFQSLLTGLEKSKDSYFAKKTMEVARLYSNSNINRIIKHFDKLKNLLLFNTLGKKELLLNYVLRFNLYMSTGEEQWLMWE
jgi:hypothetical protein